MNAYVKNWIIIWLYPCSLTIHKRAQTYVETFFDIESKTTNLIPNTCLNILKSHKHVLIIGDSGAGKTTMLLKLAIAWLQTNEELSIPVIFNLASWKTSNTSFKVWLENSLVSGYGFSKNFARKALKKQLILPLLDGLDEVGRTEVTEQGQQKIQGDCLASIDTFVSYENVSHFVICSRRNDYTKIVQDAPIRTQILINPLSSEQIDYELDKVSHKNLANREINVLKKISSILKTDRRDFANVLCNLFYFNLAFDTDDLIRTSSDLQTFPSGEVEIQKYLTKTFINNKLENGIGISPKKASYYLSWLAHWLQNRNSVTFELADFQPEDLKRKRFMHFVGSFAFGFLYAFMYVMLISLIVSSVGGLLGGVFIGMEYDIRILGGIIGAVLGLFLGVILGLILGSIYSLIKGPILGLVIGLSQIVEIKTEDIRHFKLKEITFSTWKRIFRYPFKRGLSYGMLYAFITGLGLLMSAGVREILYIEPNVFSQENIENILEGDPVSYLFFLLGSSSTDFGNLKGLILVLGLILGFGFGFVFDFIENIIKEISTISYFEVVKSPYHRLKRGLSFKILQIIIYFSFFIFASIFFHVLWVTMAVLVVMYAPILLYNSSCMLF